MRKFGKTDRFEKNKRFVSKDRPEQESGRNWVSELSKEESEKVKSFFESNYSVPKDFWSNVVLFKKVHSVWICSKKAWEVQKAVRAKSVGLMLVQELESMKTGKQAEYLFGSLLPLQKPGEN